MGAANFSTQCINKCIWIPDNLSKIIGIDYGMFNAKIIKTHF